MTWKTDDVVALGELADTFFAKEVVPLWDQADTDRALPRSVWTKAGELGLLLSSIPTAYGGGGGTFAHELAVFEAQARAGDTGFGIGVHSGIVAHYLHDYGTEEQKLRWLPKLASGEWVAAIAMTEPGAGSDLKAITTRAVKTEDGYVLNGQKTFISNGATADLVVVVAKTDPAAGAKGVSLLVVEVEGTTGYSHGRPLEKIGMHGQDTAELAFDDVLVPLENLLGQEGGGFGMLMNQLKQERLIIGIGAIGAAETALQETVRYTKSREVFGAPVFDMQHTKFELAECATLVKVARVFLDDCIEKHLRGEFDATTAAMVKWWLTEVQCQVTDRCLQLFGGYGFMKEYLISRLYNDARVQKIYGGTNEVMKDIISRGL
jgi:acyl-CoA dehydrogenase